MDKKRKIAVFSLSQVPRMIEGLKKINSAAPNSTIIVCPAHRWMKYKVKLRAAAPKCSVKFQRAQTVKYDDNDAVEFAGAVWKSSRSIIVTEGAPVRSIQPMLDMSVRMSCIRKFQIVN